MVSAVTVTELSHRKPAIASYSVAEGACLEVTGPEMAQKPAGLQTDWLEHIGYGCLVLDHSGIIQFANARLRELFPALPFSGTSFRDLLPEASARVMDRHFTDARDSGRVVKFDEYVEEHMRWYSVSVHPMPQGLMLFLRDTGSAAEQDYRTRTLLRYASDGLLLLNADFSEQFHQSLFTGFTGEEAGALQFRHRVPDRDWQRIEGTVAQLKQGESSVVRFRLHIAPDDCRFIEATVTNRLRDPGTRALVFNYRDVTNEKQAAAALASREASLEAVRTTLEMREQRLDRLHKVARIAARGRLTLDEIAQRVMAVVAPDNEVAARIFLKSDDRMRRAADSELELFPRGSAQDIETRRLAVRAHATGKNVVMYIAQEPSLAALAGLGFHSIQVMPFSRSGIEGVSIALFRWELAQESDVRPYTETVADFVTGAVATRHLIERLERSASDSHALARFGHRLEGISETSELIGQAMNSLYDQLGLRLAVFADIKGDYAVPRVVLGARTAEEQSLAMRPLPLKQGVNKRVLKDRLPVLVPDYSKLDDAQEHLRVFGLRSAIGVPVINGNHVNHMVLAGHADDDRQFNEAELSMASLFVQRLASALQRVSYLNEIRSTRDATFRALGRALEHRDYETLGHTDRVTRLMQRFANILAVPQRFHNGLVWGAYLHDLGKLSVPDEILLKPGKLTAGQFDVVKKHTLVGAEMCRDIPFLPQITHQIVRSHHERWDGSGYPDELSGEDIPLSARMFALVDVFDALTSERVYKEAWSVEKALREISSLSGSQFDPALVPEFVKLVQELHTVT